MIFNKGGVNIAWNIYGLTVRNNDFYLYIEDRSPFHHHDNSRNVASVVYEISVITNLRLTYHCLVLRICSSEWGLLVLFVVICYLFIVKLLPEPILPLDYYLSSTISIIKQWVEAQISGDNIVTLKANSEPLQLTMNHWSTPYLINTPHSHPHPVTWIKI